MAVSNVLFLVLNFYSDGWVVVKMHREGESLNADEGSDDSDYESSPEQTSDSTPEAQDKEQKGTEPESLPVLTIGSFARYIHRRWQVPVTDLPDSWRSLFFYLCTDIIQFAPLKSQSVSARARYVQEETTPYQSPPCSPKSIYSLAAAVSSHVCVHCVSGTIQHSISSLGLRRFAILHSRTYG